MFSRHSFYLRNSLVAVAGLGAAYLVASLLLAPGWWYVFDGQQLYRPLRAVDATQVRSAFEIESAWNIRMAILAAAIWVVCGVVRSGRKGDGVRSWWLWLLLTIVAAAVVTAQGLASNLETGTWWAALGSVLLAGGTFWLGTLITSPQTRKFSAPLSYHLRGHLPW